MPKNSLRAKSHPHETRRYLSNFDKLKSNIYTYVYIAIKFKLVKNIFKIE